MFKLVFKHFLVQFQLIYYLIGVYSDCSAETYQTLNNNCPPCSFKCQVCQEWKQCLKCQPGYSLFTTLDQRVICQKTCKTLWVTDQNGDSYLQGFFLHKGKCMPCLKGCLNCQDDSSCFECGNSRTGIKLLDQQVCEALIPGSCPASYGFEQRLKRCVDCSFGYMQFQKKTTSYPSDPTVCDSTDVYSSKECPPDSLVFKGSCLRHSNISSSVSNITKEQIESLIVAGCESIVISTQSSQTIGKCKKCNVFYIPKLLSGSDYTCVSKTNSGIGDCAYDATKGCVCTQNEETTLTEVSYDPKDPSRQDIVDQDSSLACPIKINIRQRYSYNIAETVCNSFQGMLFPPTASLKPNEKQVCVTTCPSIIDDKGQYLDYYTQWEKVTLNAQSLPVVKASCVVECSEGYAVDTQNKQCQQCTTSDVNCKRCSISNLSQCIECKQGYSLNDLGNCVNTCSNFSTTKGNIQYCLTCDVKDCIRCSSPNQCDQCLYNFDPTKNCSTCLNGYSLSFNDKTKCTICDTEDSFFYEKDQVCHEKCGKGLRFTGELQCDDGNLTNGDGCDSNCQIEAQWKCVGGSPTSKDTCYTINIDDAIQQNIDPNFEFNVNFKVEKSGAPLVQILFTQQPIISPNIPLSSVFKIIISSLSSSEYSYTISQISRRLLSTTEYIDLFNYGEDRCLQSTLYGYNVHLELNTTLKNQQVIVQVNQTQIKNQNGKLLYKSSEIAPIQNYVYVSPSEQKQAEQVSTAAQAAQGTVVVAGLSFAIMNNFYSLMAIVDITELIYYFLYLDIDYPKNVSSFFTHFDNFQLPFLPNPFEKYVKDVKQNCHPHVYTLDTDSLFLRNAGTNILAIMLFIGFFITFKIISLIFKKFLNKYEKLNSLIHKLSIKIQYNTSIELIYVVFLNICGSTFLQFQDTEISKTSNKEFVAELINIIIFSVTFVALLVIPTLQIVFLYRNRKIIEFSLEDYEQHIDTSSNNQESPEKHSCHNLQEKTPCKNNVIIKNLHEYLTKEIKPKNNQDLIHTNENLQQQITSKQQIQQLSENQLYNEQQMKQKLHQEHEEFLEKWESIIVGMKTSDFKFYSFNVITYYRKMIMMAIFMCLMDYTEIQVQLLVLQHICVAVYITKYMPFEKFTQNIVNIITEILFILLELFIIRLSSSAVDQEDQDERNHLGLWIICFLLSIIGIHLLLMIYETALQAYEVIQAKLKSRKNNKTLSVVIPENTLKKEKVKQILSDREYPSDSANNSIIISKKKTNISQFKTIQQEKHLSEQAKTIQLFDTNLRTPQNFNEIKNQVQQDRAAKLNAKDTSPISPLSEEVDQINKKGSSGDDEDDYEINTQNKIELITPTSKIPLQIKNSRRRSTKTQDQTPFAMRNSRLSVLFKSDSNQQTFNEQIKAHLRIPTLSEIHEISNSPKNQSNDQKEANQTNSYQPTSQLNSAKRDSISSLNYKEENSPEKLKFQKIRSRNISRLSLFNIQSDNQLFQPNTQNEN